MMAFSYANGAILMVGKRNWDVIETVVTEI